MNNVLISALATGSRISDNLGQGGKTKTLFRKLQLSNEMEVFDFDEDIVINKMEKMIQLLNEAL